MLSGVLLSINLGVILALIVPLIKILFEQKMSLLASIGTLVQEQSEILHSTYKKKNKGLEAKEHLEELIAFRDFVEKTSVIPAASQVVNSAAISVAFVVFPVIISLIAK